MSMSVTCVSDQLSLRALVSCIGSVLLGHCSSLDLGACTRVHVGHKLCTQSPTATCMLHMQSDADSRQPWTWRPKLITAETELTWGDLEGKLKDNIQWVAVKPNGAQVWQPSCVGMSTCMTCCLRAYLHACRGSCICRHVHVHDSVFEHERVVHSRTNPSRDAAAVKLWADD